MNRFSLIAAYMMVAMVAHAQDCGWALLGSGVTGWNSPGSGALTPGVYALTVFDDGSGPALYAGGQFREMDGQSANHIARWDGSAWSSLGSGISNNHVLALTTFDDGSGAALYAGGDFTSAGGQTASRIAKWDGTSWSPLGSGVTFRVHALTVFDDGSGPTLYVGGGFTTPNAQPEVHRIVRWDGTAWSVLGSGFNQGSISALTVFDDGSGPALYVGGIFTAANGQPGNYVAKWDGKSWSPLGSGMNNAVAALTVFDDGSGPALYVGGSFTTAGGQPANRIAKWDGTSWSPLGSGVASTIEFLTVFDDMSGRGAALYAGGWITTAGGQAANGIAKWDGTSWSPLGSGVNNHVSALAVFDDGSGPALYAGGSLTTAGGQSAGRIAEWRHPTARCPADTNGDCSLNFFDLSGFVDLHQQQDPVADFNGDGQFNFFDFSAYLLAFNAGCP